MNNDMAFEILLHLPVLSLLRFRFISKFWFDIIDSSRFRKLHTELHNNNNNDDDKADAVYLRSTFLDHRRKLELSIKLLDNGKSLKSYDLSPFDPKYLKIVGAVKGIIGISSHHSHPITICNPFLGQLKILPLSPISSSHSCESTHRYDTRLGFDGEDYKVVQLMSCFTHEYHYANLYSRRTNSWRELVFDLELCDIKPIKSLCKNGSFVHWEGEGEGEEEFIVSFDMKNEVFRTITILGTDELLCDPRYRYEIFAKDECSFLLFVSNGGWIKVYESRSEGSELKLNWIKVCDSLPIWNNTESVVFKNCVVLHKFLSKVVFYDYRARKFIGRCFERSANSDIIEHEGSFITP